MPNIGHIQIWMQRITIPLDKKYGNNPYSETLCKIIYGDHNELWNLDWLKPDLCADIPIDKICDKVIEYGAQRIVVGLPKNMDGTSGERAQECTYIANAVGEKSGVETLLWDERCTTVTAHNYLSMNDVRGKKRKQTVDAVAAVIILEDYLSLRKNKKA